MLRPVAPGDLDHFFQHQADSVASELADVPRRDRGSFDARWAEILRDPQISVRTIEADGAVAGYVFAFPFDGELRLGYWLGRGFWGRGIASRAVADFLALEARRPICATVHRDNAASIRILERNGFATTENGDRSLRFELR